MAIYTDLLQALKGERLSSVFSPDGTLISASAAPQCGAGAASRTEDRCVCTVLDEGIVC